jgi:hypothetical protein
MSVVVPGVNLLSLGSLDEHSTAIFLDLLAGDELHGDHLGLGGLVLDDDKLLSDLLRLGGLVLDGDDEAVLECRCLQLSASVRHALQSQLSQCTPSRRSS